MAEVFLKHLTVAMYAHVHVQLMTLIT